MDIQTPTTRGKTAPEAVRKLGAAEQTSCRTKRGVRKGVPHRARSTIGPEVTANRARERLERVGVKTPSAEPGTPWENGDVESFNGTLRNELTGAPGPGVAPHLRFHTPMVSPATCSRPHCSPAHRKFP